MEKIYRFTFIFLLVILLLANLLYFTYNGRLLSYFENKDELESADEILSQVELGSKSDFFDLKLLDDERYQALKDFEFKISEPVRGDNNLELEESDPVETSFDLGNTNPFRLSF